MTFNWGGACTEVSGMIVPRHAKTIGSDFVLPLKQMDKGARLLKARLLQHGNRDRR